MAERESDPTRAFPSLRLAHIRPGLAVKCSKALLARKSLFFSGVFPYSIFLSGKTRRETSGLPCGDWHGCQSGVGGDAFESVFGEVLLLGGI